ncbi:hypothetical protein Kpol_2000p59 [Vanderwaltozyma polyspora DSM 70294]|uniref:Ubiquitin fusion degradation protein 1 n=1 Tax=Vanderwaltozyma polyspora (strain ATCC 22028 / DSM 70294 / BCRC 21397 / CBS 2163 / NBRC 10782 / NRRL Y-8283 / UCD 57-17) TaxID=436907 RepID=A7TF67_VANPO|nr:uncharacterized protein Kpol_2000p59 [Vanderwaltozyma polyspora DSM 70294]EDO19092.1 hypothetical protein Kpol_2000p59 [Vanderwaltozyma polyspora DSM 70294]
MFSGFGSYDGNQFASIPQKFESFFRCYPISMMNDRIRKDDANYGGKIFLPPSALNKLTMLNIRYPMLFELMANENGKITHGGVLEFIAEEGRTYLPNWMMETLDVKPGSLLKISTIDIPLGSYVNIEPQSVDFLDISDPKAVLENVLRNFSTLTINDIIEISYNNKIYRIKILEVKPESPSKGICVIETDLITDFAPPVGYVEPDYRSEAAKNEVKKDNAKIDPSNISQGSMSKRIDYHGIVNKSNLSTTFGGQGQKLSGMASKKKSSTDLKNIEISLEGIPLKLDLSDGQLFFGFPIVLPKKEDDKDNETSSTNFSGQGQSLRKSNKRKGKSNLENVKTKSPKSPEVIEID